MATVITNLLSAIPWLGKSLVESTYMKVLLNKKIISSDIFNNKKWKYLLLYNYIITINIIYVWIYYVYNNILRLLKSVMI